MCGRLYINRNEETVPDSDPEDAKELEHMHVSGGKLGMQLTLLPEDLAKAANAQFADVIHKD